jgi:PAS domain-containing protein
MLKSAEPGHSLDRWLGEAGLDAESLARSLIFGPRRGIAIADVEGLIRFAGGPAADALGLEPGRALGEAAPELTGDLARALRGEPPGDQVAVRRGALSLLARVSPIRGPGGVGGVICVLVDGAERDEVLRRMRDGEELAKEQEAIINSMSDGLWVCDGKANVLRINPASARLTPSSPARWSGAT